MSAPRISFEFFPPKSLDASFRLWETVQALRHLAPSFVSVTYGAGGSTRKLTHEAVATIHRHYGLNVAAHLTCVDASRDETLEIARAYAAAGVTESVALRGDPPKGAGRFTPRIRATRVTATLGLVAAHGFSGAPSGSPGLPRPPYLLKKNASAVPRRIWSLSSTERKSKWSRMSATLAS